jgi:chitodextrinase
VSGTSLRFDGTGSSDFDGTVTQYLWTFGDGGSATGPTPSHVYAAVTSAKSYQVALTVKDDDGLSSVAAKVNIVVLPPGPIARWTCSVCTSAGGQAVAGEPVTFDATTSTDDGGTGTPNGTITNYGWTFGDGASATGITTSHAFADPGTYSVTLRVTDNDNLVAAESAAITVVAAANPPAPPPLPQPLRPALSSVRLAPKGPKAKNAAKATVTFNLAIAGAVSARLDRIDSGRRSGKRCVKPTPANRRARKCDRVVKIAGRTLAGRTGSNKTTLGSLSRGHKLIPGRYRVTLKTTAGTKTITFRVAK